MSHLSSLAKIYKTNDLNVLKTAIEKDLKLINEKISGKSVDENNWFFKHVPEKIDKYDIDVVNVTDKWCIVHDGTIQAIKTCVRIINKKNEKSYDVNVVCTDGYIFIVDNYLVCLSYKCTIIDMQKKKEVLSMECDVCGVYYDDIYMNVIEKCVLFKMEQNDNRCESDLAGYHIINLNKMKSSKIKVKNNDISEYLSNEYVTLDSYLKNMEVYNALNDTYDDFVSRYC